MWEFGEVEKLTYFPTGVFDPHLQRFIPKIEAETTRWLLSLGGAISQNLYFLVVVDMEKTHTRYENKRNLQVVYFIFECVCERER